MGGAVWSREAAEEEEEEEEAVRRRRGAQRVQPPAMIGSSGDASPETKGEPPVPSSGASRLWRLSNLSMAIFFGLAGAVQVNDPDPGLWIVAYSVPAALTLVVSLSPPIADNIVWRSLSNLHSAACVVGSAILGWSLFANAQNNILHEEEGRNSLGGIRLVIAISLSLFPFAMWLYIYMNAEMRESWPSHCKTVI